MPCDIGPLQAVPVACALGAGAGAEQVSHWQAFDLEFAHSRSAGEGRLSISYANTADAVARLRALVAVETSCCSFVEWAIDESQDALVLEIRGSDEAIAMLSIA